MKTKSKKTTVKNDTKADTIVLTGVGEGNTKPPLPKQVSACKNWVFTYNNYKDVPMFVQLLRATTKRYIFQQETGSEGTPHLQGYCEFEFRTRPKSKIDIKEIHWEIARDVGASIRYCSKEDTRTGEIFCNRIAIPKELSIINNLREWQKDIEDILLKDSDDRSIYWYWEKTGGIGKTVFCKYLAYWYGALVLSGKAADMKFGILKYIEKNGSYPNIIIFDCPRSNLDYLSYTGIEEVKNGIFFSSKYESDMVIGNCPHVIVFANEAPLLDKLSKDRWIVREI